MNKAIVNGIEYNIPETWDEVTVRQQIAISEVTDRDDMFLNYYLISQYTGIDLELIKKMNINQFKQIMELMSFLNEKLEPKTITSFEFKGEKYYLMDSLLKGETQDFLSIEGIMKKYKDNPAKALPYIIGIIAKKQGESLSDYDVWKRGELFMELPYPIANDIWFFFANSEKILSNNIQQYLIIQDKVMEASLSYSESMLKQSDGQRLSMRLAKATLLYYIRFIRKDWTRFLTGIQSESSITNSKQKSKKSKLKRLVQRVKDKFG
jgi:hypothetical protein